MIQSAGSLRWESKCARGASTLSSPPSVSESCIILSVSSGNALCKGHKTAFHGVKRSGLEQKAEHHK